MSDLSPLSRALALRSWRAALVGIAAAIAIYGLERLAPAGWPRGALASVAWLANRLAERGERLTAGMLVFSGGLTAPVPLTAAAAVTAEFDGLGTIEAFVR